MTWHHAYNGIPAIREPCDGNGPNSALYKDDVPSGHDHLAAGRLSGELAVKIVAASPTIPGQQLQLRQSFWESDAYSHSRECETAQIH